MAEQDLINVSADMRPIVSILEDVNGELFMRPISGALVDAGKVSPSAERALIVIYRPVS